MSAFSTARTESVAVPAGQRPGTMKAMGTNLPHRAAASVAGSVMAAVAVAASTAAPAWGGPPEEKFISDIERSNSVATTIPGTPERWVAAGYATCNRITSTIAQGLAVRAAINNEVIAAGTFNSISRQDSVALVTYAVLDLCPQVIPPRAGVGQPAPGS